MLKHIRFASSNIVNGNSRSYRYLISDDDLNGGYEFEIEQIADSFTFNSLPTFVLIGIPGLAATIREYQNHHLPVVKNVVHFYSCFRNTKKDLLTTLELDRQWLDQYVPDLDYGKYYYNCVVNQIKRSQYARRY